MKSWPRYGSPTRPGPRRFSPRRRTQLHAITGAMLAGLGTGCSFGSGPDHNTDAAPRMAAPEDIRALQGSLALVLSSGGPRGFVHVGVLMALDEIGFRPDLVVGASVGALLGALYCSGLNGRQLHEQAMDLSVTTLASLAIGAEETFNGSPIVRFVNELTAGRPLQAFTPRAALAALDLQTRRPVLFTRGDPGVAVQASAAIEGRFTPVTIRSRRYADADSVMPMPVRLSRQLGATTVLSIDASAHEDRAPAGAGRYRQGDLLKRARTRPDALSADLNLHPFFGYWVSMKREFRARAIHAGYMETMRHEKEIRALQAAHTGQA